MDFLLKEITTDDIEHELLQIGFSEGYHFCASDKFRFKNIKIYNLTVPQANILKQTALSVGTDCAVNKNVVTGQCDLSDVILSGSISQLKNISKKLSIQPFKLNELGKDILDFLNKRERNTKLAGILNITPNSFSDGGKYFNIADAQNHLVELINDGADLIDIGAESTKPYSEAVEPEEQIRRLKPVLDFIRKENIQIPISIDTRSSSVAEFVLDCGAEIINDVSGFDYDAKMPDVIAKYNAKVIIQHSKGSPQDMQNSPHYNNVIDEIFESLNKKIICAKETGIQNIIIDPGIGFGKRKEDNFEILNRIEEFYAFNCPVMVGVSRKSLLEVTNDNNELKDALTLAVSYPLIKKGVDYLRVHNVKLHKHLLNL